MGRRKKRRFRPVPRTEKTYWLAQTLAVIFVAALLSAGFFVAAQYHFAAMDLNIKGQNLKADEFSQIARYIAGGTTIFVLAFAIGMAIYGSFSKGKTIVRRRITRYQAVNTKAPRLGMTLLALITCSRDRDVALDHLEERFEKDTKKLGRRRAILIMMRDLIASLPPNLWSGLMRLIRWAFVGTIVERVFFR